MFFKKLIGIIIDTVKLVKGKAKVTDIVFELIAKLPTAVFDAIAFHKLDTAEKLDEALEGFDLYTGVDVGAVDLIKDLPADKEEELMDHIKGIIEILGKNQLKVPGYHV